jgi:hypothetical protein
MLTAPGTPTPQSVRFPLLRDRNAKSERAAQVIALGLMNRKPRCGGSTASDGSFQNGVYIAPAANPTLAELMPEFFPVPLNLYTGNGVAAGSYGPGIDATVPLPVAAQIYQNQQPSHVAVQSTAMNPATSTQGGSGASASPSDFAGAPQVQPMNISPEMLIASNPQALMERRKRRKQASAETSDRSSGVTWGGAPSAQAGACGRPGGLSLAAILLIASGLGVIVYAVAAKK